MKIPVFPYLCQIEYKQKEIFWPFLPLFLYTPGPLTPLTSRSTWSSFVHRKLCTFCLGCPSLQPLCLASSCPPLQTQKDLSRAELGLPCPTHFTLVVTLFPLSNHSLPSNSTEYSQFHFFVSSNFLNIFQSNRPVIFCHSLICIIYFLILLCFYSFLAVHCTYWLIRVICFVSCRIVFFSS